MELSCFKAYDIRGLLGETLDEAIAVLRNLEAEETDHGGVDENPTA